MARVGGGVFERRTENGRTVFDPIPGARVVFLEEGNPGNIHFMDTTSNGRYALDMPPARYNFVAGANGYETFETISKTGVAVIRDDKPNTVNFFLKPDGSSKPVRKTVTIDVVVQLPDVGDGKPAAERGVSGALVYDPVAGTVAIDPLPPYRNEAGIAFEAEVETSNGRFDKATGHATMTASVTVDPDLNIFGKDIVLRDITLSTEIDTGFPTFAGVSLDVRKKWLIMVGKGKTEHAGRFASRPRMFDDETALIKVIVAFDDLTGLT